MEKSLLQKLYEAVTGFSCVIQADELEDDGFSIRVDDDTLTDEEYEAGIYVTKQFTQDLEQKLNAIGYMLCNDALKETGQLVKVVLTHQDKDWFKVELEFISECHFDYID